MLFFYSFLVSLVLTFSIPTEARAFMISPGYEYPFSNGGTHGGNILRIVEAMRYLYLSRGLSIPEADELLSLCKTMPIIAENGDRGDRDAQNERAKEERARVRQEEAAQKALNREEQQRWEQEKRQERNS